LAQLNKKLESINLEILNVKILPEFVIDYVSKKLTFTMKEAFELFVKHFVPS